jgi:hypothetical protein
MKRKKTIYAEMGNLLILKVHCIGSYQIKTLICISTFYQIKTECISVIEYILEVSIRPLILIFRDVLGTKNFKQSHFKAPFSFKPTFTMMIM